MKALSMRISAGVIALAALIYMSACSSPGGNINQNRSINQNQSINQNESIAANTDETVRTLGPCRSHPDPAATAADILQRLKAEINGSDAADEMKPDPTSARGRFTVDVQQATGKMYFEAYIKGEVGGDDNLKILSDILNNFQDENDCLRVAYFVENLNAPNTPSGFKWSSCQYPLRVCSNGECCEVQPVDTPAATPTPSPTPNPLSTRGANSDISNKGNTNN
jgi:hypothetical protein